MKTLKQVTIIPQFVHFVPEKMEQGVMYISKEYGVARHLCLCGCGVDTVLPLSHDMWIMTENGDKVSFTPSIANYQFPCNSHYIITNNVANFV